MKNKLKISKFWQDKAILMNSYTTRKQAKLLSMPYPITAEAAREMHSRSIKRALINKKLNPKPL